MESTPLADQAHQGLYTKSNIRQSKSISLTRPYVSSRTRQRALSTASASSGSFAQSYNLNPASPNSVSDLASSDPLSHQSASSTSKPRKRLSMNFALPVLPDGISTTPRRSTSYGTSNSASATTTMPSPAAASNGGSANSSTLSAAYHHSATPSTSSINSTHTGSSISGTTGSHHHHAKTQSFSHVLTSPRHHQLSSTASPSTSPRHKQSTSVSYTHAHLKNMSTDSTASYGSDSSTYETPDTVEFYFSQLAFKERRVVELKDEIQRLQLLLKQAESEFQYYYNCAEQKLKTVIPNTPSTEDPNKALTATSTAENNTPMRTRRLSRIHSPFTFMDNLNEPRRQHKKSGSSISSSSTSHHSNSLSDSSQSSVETLAEPLHEKTSSAVYSNHNNYSMSHQHAVDSLYQPASTNCQQQSHDEEDSGDFLNKSRRVVEELGTQFWSLFEDIKNVTIGEEARDTSHDQDHYRRRSSGRHHTSSNNHYGNHNAMIVEEEPEVIVTGVSTNVQRRANASNSYSSTLRNSSSMQNIRRASQGGVADVMNSSSKHLCSVPETTSASNSYFVV